MNPDKLVDLLGHSVNHPDFQPIFEQLNYKKPVAVEAKHGLNIDRPFFHEIGLAFVFTTQIGLTNNYVISPKSVFTRDKYELILQEVSFYDKGRNNIPYPFQLKFGDSYEETVKKIGVKSTEKSKTAKGGYLFYYYTGISQLLVYTDDDKKLESVIVRVMEQLDQKRLERKKKFKELSKLINTDNIGKIQKLKEDLLTEEWRIRLKEDDPSFTEKNIQLSETALIEFIDSVIKATEEEKANKILAAVKKVVVTFNKLNDKYEFIDTMEREELVDFIIKIVELTGFKVEGADITDEWREW